MEVSQLIAAFKTEGNTIMADELDDVARDSSL